MLNSASAYEFIMFLKISVWILMAFVFFKSKISSIFHPFFFYLIFDFLVFTFRAPLIYFGDYNFVYNVFQFLPNFQDKSNALLATLFGLISFGIASMSTGRTPIVFYDRSRQDAERGNLLKPLLVVVLILGPLGVYSLLQSWNIGATGDQIRQLDQATGVAYNTSSNGYVFEARNMLGPMAVLFAWITRFRWYSSIPLLAFLLLSGGSGTRGPFVIALTSLGLVWLYEHRRRWPKMSSLFFVMAAVFLFTTVGQDRGRWIRSLFLSDQVTQEYRNVRQARFLEGMDFANLEYLEYLTYVVPERSQSYGYFLDNLQIFTEPVPRVLWKNKPLGEPIRMFSLFDYGYPIGMTRSLPGEGWYNLGHLGVIIWCSLFGAIWGRFYESFAKRKTPSNLRFATYMVLLPLSVLFYRDGVAMTMLRFGAFLVIPILLLNWIKRYFRPAPSLRRIKRRFDRAPIDQRNKRGEHR